MTKERIGVGFMATGCLLTALWGCGECGDVSSSAQPSVGPRSAADKTSASSSAAPVPGSAAPPAAPPTALDKLNVLVISVDALRADHLAFAGYNPDVMPTVNALEKTAVSYTNFHSLSSFTAQSIGGFLGCRYPSELKRNGSFFAKYPPEETLFPELLQKAGVRTMSAQAHFYFEKGRAGFDQGFDVYEIVPGIKKNNSTDNSITSPAHTKIAIQQLGDVANTQGRFFAWYHLLDAHDQYKSHPEGKDFGSGAKNLYDGELYFVDMHIKQILDLVDKAPWGKSTMVIITADHGEAFGEHKQYLHAFEVWHHLTHVPLIIRAPGLTARRIDEPRSMIDLCPTILETFSVAPEPAFHGKSLWPELRGGPAEPRDVVTELAKDSNNEHRRALLRGDWKIIESGSKKSLSLFNVKDDPAEEKTLVIKEKAKFEEMREALKAAASKIKEIRM